MKRINLSMLPVLLNPHETAGRLFVVIDILRATTSIATAIDAGVQHIVPCLEVEEARNLASQHDNSNHQPLLGGERGGQRIPGFDLGNSPSDYRSETVAGKVIYFSTTNGTKAMMRCIGAARIFIGAFVNLSAVTDAAMAADEIELLCAGTNDQVTREDVLMAGAFVNRAIDRSPVELNDQAQLALEAWQSLQDISQKGLSDVLRNSHGGRNLQKIGLDADIHFAANMDRFQVVPELDMSSWRISMR